MKFNLDSFASMIYTDYIKRPPETVKYGVTARPKLYDCANMFSRILEDSAQNGFQANKASSRVENYANKDGEHSNRVRVGYLSKEIPSVSDLLIKHPVYGKNCWKIIHADSNQGKAFRKIEKGAAVYLNPETHEITWRIESTRTSGTVRSVAECADGKTKRNGHVHLGSLSRKTPTVSHLLVDHPTLGKDCWRILKNDLNRSKEFGRIPMDTPVYLNSRTGEITWGKRMAAGVATEPEVSAAAKKALEISATTPLEISKEPMKESGPFSERLASQVKCYVGTSYHKMNCFELVVRAIENVGIQYKGADGLGSRLIRRALAKGLPENHYLSGEGLIKTSGSLVYTKSFSIIKHPGREAKALYKRIEPLLRKGQILSFSTPSRGHTGIVSRRGKRWTFINSGNMDHVISGRRRKGVGEEALKPEIANWLGLAAAEGESLGVTIGTLNEAKLKGPAGLMQSSVGENSI